MSTPTTNEAAVVLVDEHDHELGTLGKLAAHVAPGHLHRGVSLCLFDASGRVLLQRRASEKYHFAGLWANACCTHPVPGEDPGAAVVRRAAEELRVGVRQLRSCGTFVYRADDLSSGLVEWEVDHVYAAFADGEPDPDPREIADLLWVTPVQAQALAEHTDAVSPWLHSVLSLALAGS